jgi:hypothetical protein
MEKKILKRYRRVMIFFIIMLMISGITAVPVEAELVFLNKIIPEGGGLYLWINKVLTAYREVNAEHPYLLYGYDWLAFAHVIIGLFFIGAYRDPVRNVWIVKAGLFACVLIFPLAFIAGYFRDIPLGWQMIDCSFGIFGALPLYYCLMLTNKLENQQKINQQQNGNNDYSNRLVERQIAG